MNPTIEIIVSPTGQAQVLTRGFAGSNCRAASRFIELALGKPTQEQLTSEFYQPASLQTDLESHHQ